MVDKDFKLLCSGEIKIRDEMSPLKGFTFLQSAEDLVIYICLLNSLCCLWLPMLRRKLPPEYLAYLLKIYLCFVCVSEILVLIILILLIFCFGYGMRNRYKRCYFSKFILLSQHCFMNKYHNLRCFIKSYISLWICFCTLCFVPMISLSCAVT